MPPEPTHLDFAGVTVLCVCDIMLDRFVHGRIERISPEVRIPAIRLTETRQIGRVYLARLMPGRSTTGIVRRLREPARSS